jgi:hypothetical protein
LKSSRYLDLLLSFAVTVLLLWVASRKTFFGDTISSPFLAIALFSVFLILLRTKPSWKELACVAVLFLTLAGYDLGVANYPGSWPVWASFLGIAGLGGLCFRTIWLRGEERLLAAWALGPAFLFVASEWMASYLLEWTEKAHPKVLDLYLYSFDSSLHLQLPFVLGRLFGRFPVFGAISLYIYVGLPIAIGLTYAGCLMRDRRSALPALVAFLVAGPLGVLFYNLLPAMGPIHVFLRDFPGHPLSYAEGSRLFLEPVSIAGPRNAFPSLHAAWIFLVFWYARNLSLGEKVASGILVFFTLCATLGTGEHYTIDLIAAVPFSLLVVALADVVANRGWHRVALPVLTGLTLTLAWIAALRFATKAFWVSPVFPWIACAVTLLVSFVAGKGLLGSRTSSETNPSPLGAALTTETTRSMRTPVSIE